MIVVIKSHPSGEESDRLRAVWIVARSIALVRAGNERRFYLGQRLWCCILNTKFIIFNAKFIILNAQFMIVSTCKEPVEDGGHRVGPDMIPCGGEVEIVRHDILGQCHTAGGLPVYLLPAVEMRCNIQVEDTTAVTVSTFLIQTIQQF